MKLGIRLALCLALSAPLSAHAGSSEFVQFGQNIHVDRDQEATDAVCFFCSVTVDGDLKGDAVIFFGDLNINGKLHGDAVVFGGTTKLAGDASIGGDSVNMGGSLRMDQGSTIHGDRVSIPEIVVLVPILIAIGIPFLLIYGIYWLFQRTRRPAYPYPPVR